MTSQATSRDCFINGIWQPGAGEAFHKTSPATGETSWSGKAASTEQVILAVDGARRAFETWSARDVSERQAILVRYADELKQRSETLASAISRDMGKLMSEARAEVTSMIAKVDISITAQADRADKRSVPTDFGRLDLTHRPHGVMAVLGPYNFPGHLPNGHIVPALLAGNTCVFKPSELAPSVAPVMIEALEAAGVDSGAVNLVQGGRNTGMALLESDIDGLLFTGSETTGLFFHRYFAGRPEVMLALEMGGNNPLIVWDAADADNTADIAIRSAFLTTGQRCSCARRLILPHGRTGDEILERLLSRARDLTLGSGEETAFMGPLVSVRAAQYALDFQDMLTAKGGKILLALEQVDRDRGFVTPGVMEMSASPSAPDEELFGPLLQIYRAHELDQAIRMANTTRFGLSAGLVSDDPLHWKTASQKLRAGIVNFNMPTVGASSQMPFGGPGRSGNFRPGGAYAADYCAWPQASQVAVRT